MDRLLRDAQVPTTLITSKQIPDYSTRAPVAAKEMVVTALLQMSRLSNAFRYVDYEVDLVRQDTVQNLTNILLNNNQIQLQRPSLYLSGAVSFVDQNVLNNRMEVGTSASRLETGYSKNRNATVIGLELHLGDFRTRTLIPGMDSANEVVIGSGGQGLDLAGRISEYGWQFNVGKDYAQGSGAAIRTLVELAVIELTGKWARVPYWQCLTMEQTHPNFQRQLRDWYDEGTLGVHQNLVKRSLISKGYLSETAMLESSNVSAFRAALGRFQSDNGMVVTGVVDFNTYERALRDFVSLDMDGNLMRYGWSPTASDPLDMRNSKQVAASSGKSYGKNEGPRSINLQIENVMMGRSQFEVGEQVFVSATVSRASHLACYLSNATGGVIRLIPNPMSNQSQVSANQAIRLPDWMSPNPGYMIETASPGTEGVLCVATDDDVTQRLPEAMRTEAFTPMPGIQGLKDIAKHYTEALPKGQFTSSTMEWRVAPRRIAEPGKRG